MKFLTPWNLKGLIVFLGNFTILKDSDKEHFKLTYIADIRVHSGSAYTLWDRTQSQGRSPPLYSNRKTYNAIQKYLTRKHLLKYKKSKILRAKSKNSDKRSTAFDLHLYKYLNTATSTIITFWKDFQKS